MWKRAIAGALLLVLVILAPLYITLRTGVTHDREGCERLNTVRENLYGLEGLFVNLAQQQVQTLPPGPQRAVSLNFEREYTVKRQVLVQSASMYANPPGSVHVDCARAYPEPWPF